MDLCASTPAFPRRHDPADSGENPQDGPGAQSEPAELDNLDDLSRNAFGILGMPLDALDLAALVERIDTAVAARRRLFLSTPNVNFLLTSRVDQEFRESLLLSDSCTVDGQPMVWIARLMGMPLSQRVSGSDLFDALRSRQRLDRLKVFLFGGAEGVAEALGASINAEEGGLACVGALNPGFGEISEISADPIINQINASGADFLTVFLSARKAQGFLLQNRDRLDVPVRAQLGTTINFQAGIVRRAPKVIQRIGFEWLWRVKEEPHLWRRYFSDGRGLLYLVLTSVFPLFAYRLIRSCLRRDQREPLTVVPSRSFDGIQLKLAGAATSMYIDTAVAEFRAALGAETNIVIDLSQTATIDARFFGLLLMVRKHLLGKGKRLSFVGVRRGARRLFRMNCFEFLLD
jgi:N-acetylglucosaminyldiphosphoundecaprenol N-acetyl-beta-D-mannosaminyltransferase